MLLVGPAVDAVLSTGKQVLATLFINLPERICLPTPAPSNESSNLLQLINILFATHMSVVLDGITQEKCVSRYFAQPKFLTSNENIFFLLSFLVFINSF